MDWVPCLLQIQMGDVEAELSLKVGWLTNGGAGTDLCIFPMSPCHKCRGPGFTSTF